MEIRARRLYLIFAFTLIAATDVGLVIKQWPIGFASDLSVFWGAVRYAPYAGGLTPFAYPPTTLLWLQPLRLCPLSVAYAAWSLLSVVAFYCAARQLWLTSDVRFAILSPMVLYGLIGGQFSLIVAALVFVAYSSRYRGALLGLALTVKPHAVLLAPLFLLIERDYRALVQMILTTLAISAATTMVFGGHIWIDWLQSIPKLQQALAVRNIDRNALSPATLYHLPVVPMFLLGCIIGVVLAIVVRCRDPQVKLVAMAASSLLAIPYSLRYELAIFAPAMAGYILLGNWKSLLALIPFCGTLGPPSLVVAMPLLADRERRCGPGRESPTGAPIGPRGSLP